MRTLAFLSITATFLSILNNESDSDPAAFLRFAQQVKLNGGPLSLITGLYTGEYIQANQHPFYIALLSIAPTLTFGKTLSFIAALLTYLIVGIHLIRTRGWQMATSPPHYCQPIMHSPTLADWQPVNPG